MKGVQVFWLIGLKILTIVGLSLTLAGCGTMAPQDESIPSTPVGPSSGIVARTLTYSTGGVACGGGQTIAYRFDWGDGTYSGWSSSTNATKAWETAGTYQVRAQARCGPLSLSAWSSVKFVSISPGCPCG